MGRLGSEALYHFTGMDLLRMWIHKPGCFSCDGRRDSGSCAIGADEVTRRLGQSKEGGVLSCKTYNRLWFLGLSLHTSGIGSRSVRRRMYYPGPRPSSAEMMGNAVLYTIIFGGGHGARVSLDELFPPAHEFVAMGIEAHRYL